MSRPRLLLACAVLACLAGPAVPQEESVPSDRFSEDVTVREVELVVELPRNRASLARRPSSW